MTKYFLAHYAFNALIKKLNQNAKALKGDPGFESLAEIITITSSPVDGGYMVRADHLRMAHDSIQGNMIRKGEKYDVTLDKLVISLIKEAYASQPVAAPQPQAAPEPPPQAAEPGPMLAATIAVKSQLTTQMSAPKPEKLMLDPKYYTRGSKLYGLATQELLKNSTVFSNIAGQDDDELPDFY